MEHCKKASFLNKSAASDFINALKKKGKENIPVRSYLCKKCNHWHLTSQQDEVGKLKLEIEELKKQIILKDEKIKNLQIHVTNFYQGHKWLKYQNKINKELDKINYIVDFIDKNKHL